MQMTPYLHSISDHKIKKLNLFNVMPISQFKSIRSLTLDDATYFWTFKYLSKIDSLQHLHLYINELNINIKTYDLNLTEQDVTERLNMKNITVYISHLRLQYRSPIPYK